MTAAPLLELTALHACADGSGTPLLDGVSLTVPAGSVAAVVGPSGSGKTTLGLAALGSARPGVRLHGEARLHGTDLWALPEAQRRAVRSGTAAHLPQHPELVLDPVRRVGSALRELAALRGDGDRPRRAWPRWRREPAEREARAAAVRDALETAGLPEPLVRRRFPHQLSGGQQQRLALASALVTGARLLVLDEPTSGLDPVTAAALAGRLRAAADRGVGILLLSHDLPLVRRVADTVAVLEQGRVVEAGAARKALDPEAAGAAGARHPLTRALLAAERGDALGKPRSTAAGTPNGQAAAGGEPPGDSRGVTATGVTVRRRVGGSPLHGPVTLSFPPGGVTALVGPSGAGKTTFGRVLAGLTPAGGGEITHAGERLPRLVERRTAAQRRAVQYVHQSAADSFEGHRPVLGQLATAGRLLRGVPGPDAEAEALDTAEQLGLSKEMLARAPARLSGGQLQRCALVRALLARPALLVCDEVTAGLDVVARDRVLGALPELLAPAGTALLLITHDMTAVRRCADTVAVFDAGRCVQHDATADLLRSPRPGAPAALVRAAREQYPRDTARDTAAASGPARPPGGAG